MAITPRDSRAAIVFGVKREHLEVQLLVSRARLRELSRAYESFRAWFLESGGWRWPN